MFPDLHQQRPCLSAKVALGLWVSGPEPRTLELQNPRNLNSRHAWEVTCRSNTTAATMSFSNLEYSRRARKPQLQQGLAPPFRLKNGMSEGRPKFLVRRQQIASVRMLGIRVFAICCPPRERLPRQCRRSSLMLKCHAEVQLTTLGLIRVRWRCRRCPRPPHTRP